MAERMDLLSTRSYQKDGETKTAFTKIGVAFATKNGGWSLSFEALPLPTLNDGKLETRVLMMPPKDQNAASEAPRGRGGPSGASHDDDIPFTMIR